MELTAPDVSSILTSAKAIGLIVTEETSASWKVDTTSFEELLGLAVKRLPAGDLALAELIAGLGEMAARSHFDPFAVLRSRIAAVDLLALLDGVLALQPALSDRDNSAALGWALHFEARSLNWETFMLARSLLKHSPLPVRVGRYGFRFALRLALRLALHLGPADLDRWVSAKTGHPALLSMLQAIAHEFLFAPDHRFAHSLLACRNPLLRAFGAVVIVGIDEDSDVGQGFARLVRGGIAPGDALWLAASRLKEAVHQRYRLTSRNADAHAELRQRSSSPQSDARRLDRLEERAELSKAQLAEHEQTLEGILSALAACWPDDGLTSSQLENLAPVFVETTEIRHRLALKLRHLPSRQALSECNIEQLAHLLGIDQGVGAVDDHLRFSEDRHYRIMSWAAQSFVSRHAGSRAGIGRMLGRRIGKFTEQLHALIDQPFLRSRQELRWDSATTRLAMCHLFALFVVEATPENHAHEVRRTRQLAVGKARDLLERVGEFASDDRCIDLLIQSAVWHLAQDEISNTDRAAWARSSELPTYARALCLWSDAEHAARAPRLAAALFRAVGEAPWSANALDIPFSRLVNLLDIAVAHGMGSEHEAVLLGKVSKLWNEVLPSWPAQVSAKWRDTPDKLISAIRHDGDDRAWLLASDEFTSAYCARQARHQAASGAISIV
jgi:hypothetical protein